LEYIQLEYIPTNVISYKSKHCFSQEQILCKTLYLIKHITSNNLTQLDVLG